MQGNLRTNPLQVISSNIFFSLEIASIALIESYLNSKSRHRSISLHFKNGTPYAQRTFAYFLPHKKHCGQMEQNYAVQ